LNLKAGYGLDSNGYIVSDVGIEKMDGVYVSCIRETIECLRELFPHQLHSVYVYGSVARGEAIVLKSDLDLIALFHSNLNVDESKELKSLCRELSRKYRSLVRDIGIATAYYDYTMDPSNYYENAFLKELCICVYGEDLGEKFGPYKLTSEIAVSFNGDICEVLTRTLHRLETAYNEHVKTLVQGFARKLIRTYYSMVMARSQIWTTRLHEQAEVVLHYFPKKKLIIRSLLNWIDNPPLDYEAVYELFHKEGQWACENFVKEANVLSQQG
jgi:uncharacterized protein